MRFFIRITALAILLIAVFTALIIAVEVFAKGGPSEAMILRSPACTVPCWHGILPGKTSIDEASALVHQDAAFTLITEITGSPDTHMRQVCWALKSAPQWQGCAVRSTGTQGPVDQINLVPSPALHFQLGEAMLTYRKPLAMTLCRGSSYTRLHLFFEDEVEVTAFGQPEMNRLTPEMQVALVAYHYPADEPPYPFDAAPWRGFTSISDVPYC